MSRAWEGRKRAEEARAGLLREGEWSRVPVDTGFPRAGVRVCYKVGSRAIEGAGMGREVTTGYPDWQSERKAGCDESKANGDSASTAEHGGGKSHVQSPGRGAGVAWRDAQCPLRHAWKLRLSLCDSGLPADHAEPQFPL